MTSTRAFVSGLVVSVLAGGIAGIVLNVAVDLPRQQPTVTAGVVVGAGAAALVGFLIAHLILPGRRPEPESVARPNLLVEPVETMEPEPGVGAGQAATQVVEPDAPSEPVETGPPVEPVGTGVPEFDEPGRPAGEPEPATETGSEESPVEVVDGPVLTTSAIRLAGTAHDRASAIDEAGALLVATGAVDEGYIASMHARERSVSTFMGSELAIPHGTRDAVRLIHRSAIAVVRYPDAVVWHGNPVKFVIAIAGAGDDHLKLVSAIAEVFLDERAVARLEQASSTAEVARVFAAVNR